MKIIRFIVISFLSYLFISHLARVTPRQPSKQTASTRRTVGNRCFRVPGIWLMFVFAGLAQLVEQLICNQSVIGSSPISSSRRYPLDVSNVEGTTTIETAAAAKKLIEMFGNRNIRAIAVNRVNDKSDEVIVELDFVPGLAPHLHGFTLQVNGLTCGYAGTGPSNLYEVLQAAGVSEAQVAREDITQKSTKTIPLRLERAVTQYGDFQFA